jgi:hypothetical protein
MPQGLFHEFCGMGFSDTGHELLTTVFIARGCVSDITSHIFTRLTMFKRLPNVFTLLDSKRWDLAGQCVFPEA